MAAIGLVLLVLGVAFALAPPWRWTLAHRARVAAGLTIIVGVLLLFSSLVLWLWRVAP